MRAKALTNDVKKDCIELEAILQAERLQVKAKRKRMDIAKITKELKQNKDSIYAMINSLNPRTAGLPPALEVDGEIYRGQRMENE